jgi:hypothetical protein
MNLAAIICLLKIAVSTSEWTSQECDSIAQEFISAGEKYKLDPELLVSISIYECDLDTYKDSVYYYGRQIIARDICPMGFRIKDHLYQIRGGMSRSEVIDASAELLKSYKTWHKKKCHKNHSYIQHYNSGYRIIKNGYSNNILEIYTSIKTGKSTRKPINTRTADIAHSIRKNLWHVKENYFKGCRSHACELAKR